MKPENSAIVHGKDLSVSSKHTVEIASLLRGKSINKSKQLLTDIIEKKSALPFRKYNRDIPHRRGMMAGRYPEKACLAVLKLINVLEANAQDKGLDPGNMFIKTVIANRASRPWHQGRLRRRKMKRTHLEIIAVEK